MFFFSTLSRFWELCHILSPVSVLTQGYFLLKKASKESLKNPVIRLMIMAENTYSCQYVAD